MIRIILLFFVGNLSFAQTPDVEIRLVNASIGTSYSNTSNDAGLNIILNNYNVTSYIYKAAHPYPPYNSRMISIPGVFPAQFISDLMAYSSVIESVKISDTNTFADALSLNLTNANIGSATGYSGGIATTNDSGLNAIFVNYNVFYYELKFPTLSNFQDLYSVVCNCDKNQLRAALNNYNGIIDYTENAGAAYLGINNFENRKITISPNPFTNNFDIQTEELISNYKLFDVTGKQLINTTSKEKLDNLSSQLNQGIYVLAFTFENGQRASYKLIKQ
jgi:hypothetical protein